MKPQPDPNLMASKLWAQVALDFTWEQLNLGHWKDVKRVWKEAYSSASLLKAICLALDGEEDIALVELDKGILLGAPILDNTLQKLATILTKSVNARKCSNDCSDIPVSLELEAFSSSSAPDTAPTLAPSKKVVFRNYKPIQSIDKKKPLLHNVETQPLSSRCNLSLIPLIDPQRRVRVRHCPSLEEFLEEHMKTRTPVVVSGAMDHWPAYAARKWRYILCIRYSLVHSCGLEYVSTGTDFDNLSLCYSVNRLAQSNSLLCNQDILFKAVQLYLGVCGYVKALLEIEGSCPFLHFL